MFINLSAFAFMDVAILVVVKLELFKVMLYSLSKVLIKLYIQHNNKYMHSRAFQMMENIVMIGHNHPLPLLYIFFVFLTTNFDNSFYFLVI